MKKKVILAACIAAAMSVAQTAWSQKASGPATPVAEPSVLNFLQPDHATIMVQNMDLERDWYIRVFGGTVLRTVNNPASQMVMMQIPGYRIDLLKATTTKAPLTQPQSPHLGWVHVNFSLPPEEIEQALVVLKARGTDAKPSAFAVSANSSHPGEVWLLQLHDPEGNEIEIVARGYY